METISGLVKVSLPNYIAGLPIPNSFGGWFRLGCKYNFISLLNRDYEKFIYNNTEVDYWSTI